MASGGGGARHLALHENPFHVPEDYQLQKEQERLAKATVRGLRGAAA